MIFQFKDTRHTSVSATRESAQGRAHGAAGGWPIDNSHDPEMPSGGFQLILRPPPKRHTEPRGGERGVGSAGSPRSFDFSGRDCLIINGQKLRWSGP